VRPLDFSRWSDIFDLSGSTDTSFGMSMVSVEPNRVDCRKDSSRGVYVAVRPDMKNETRITMQS